MTHILYLDTETQRWAGKIEREKIPELGLSIMITYDTKTKDFQNWMPHRMPEFESFIQNIDLVIGFNTKQFDYILLQQYIDLDLTTLCSFDMLEEVTNTLGFRVSLNNLGKQTLGLEKEGAPNLAVEWWEKCDLEKLIGYCRQDVDMTKQLFEYGCREKELKFWHPVERRLATVNTDYWAAKARKIVMDSIPF